jgi:hypothetical protein
MKVRIHGNVCFLATGFYVTVLVNMCYSLVKYFCLYTDCLFASWGQLWQRVAHCTSISVVQGDCAYSHLTHASLTALICWSLVGMQHWGKGYLTEHTGFTYCISHIQKLSNNMLYLKALHLLQLQLSYEQLNRHAKRKWENKFIIKDVKKATVLSYAE